MDKSDLVGEWRLDDGDGDTARDSSGNGHHGTLHYASWRVAEGALAFDGTNSRVVIPDCAALCLTRDISICAWVYKNAPNRGKRWDTIISKSPGMYDFELLTSKAESDQPAFFSPTCEPQEVYGAQPVPSREWHHLALARHKNHVSFFLDGTPTASVAMSGEYPVTGGDLVIGHDGAKGRGFAMNGMLRGVLLFARALDEREIRAIAAEGGKPD